MVDGGIEVESAIAGDVNCDGVVDMKDVVMLRRYIVGGYGVEVDPAIADVNDDGDVNMQDVVLMRRYIVGGYGVQLI